MAFVILLLTLKLDGFFWNSKPYGGGFILCKCCHRIISWAKSLESHVSQGTLRSKMKRMDWKNNNGNLLIYWIGCIEMVIWTGSTTIAPLRLLIYSIGNYIVIFIMQWRWLRLFIDQIPFETIDMLYIYKFKWNHKITNVQWLKPQYETAICGRKKYTWAGETSMDIIHHNDEIHFVLQQHKMNVY